MLESLEEIVSFFESISKIATLQAPRPCRGRIEGILDWATVGECGQESAGLALLEY
jgi:hypothetical protein